MKTIIEEKAPLINAAIEKYVPRSYTQQHAEFTLGKPRYRFQIESMNKAIAEPTWEFLDRGGKRWRPVLFLLVCDALGGDSKKYVDLSVLFELIHDATLIIDDIEDDAETRRGKQVLHKLYGLDIATNVGMGLSFIPLITILKNSQKLPIELENKIFRTYAQEMINIHFGQGMDICWHKGLANADHISEEEYLQMCAYKTGTLARLAAEVGALVAGSPDSTAETMGRLAESIGVAFQIQDDILDIVAEDREKFGKSFGNDITEGKRTLMVVHTLHTANKKDAERLLAILAMHTRDQKLLEEAISIIKKYGAVDYAKECAKTIVKESWTAAEKILKESKAKEQLKAFAYYLIERDL